MCIFKHRIFFFFLRLSILSAFYFTVDAVHFSERIIVGWADKEIEDKVIGDFVYLKADERPEIVHGRRKNRVLLTFKAKRSTNLYYSFSAFFFHISLSLQVYVLKRLNIFVHDVNNFI